MKEIRHSIRSFLKAATLALIAISINACNETSPFEAEEEAPITALEKMNALACPRTPAVDEGYPQSASMTINYFRARKCYRGGAMSLPNGSMFQLTYGSLTPPAGTSPHAPVTLTMACERDSAGKELLFTFGPSGSQFSPGAKVTLSWKDLNMEIPKLYYVDHKGNYVEQTPDDIDVKGKWLVIHVHHFSRYALAWSR